MHYFGGQSTLSGQIGMHSSKLLTVAQSNCAFGTLRRLTQDHTQVAGRVFERPLQLLQVTPSVLQTLIDQK